MEVQALRLFVEVAGRGSFADVARVFDMDPSSVSRAVAALEEELGSRLLQRSTRRVSLTEAGHLYLSRIAPLVEELDHARDELTAVEAEPQGTLRLTASVAFGKRCLVPLLPDFTRRFPKLRLELVLTDATLDLVSDRIDLAIRLGTNLQVDAVGTRLFETRYRVCAAPRYLDNCRAQDKPLNKPADLAMHRCLRFALPDFRTRWLFKDASGQVVEVYIDGDLTISSALALHDATLLGLGPALLPHWLIDDDIVLGALVDVFPGFRATATDFETGAWLLYPSRSYLPHKVRVTIDFLKQRFNAAHRE